jgi:hypothetical protein
MVDRRWQDYRVHVKPSRLTSDLLGTREHFMDHLARDWPELVPRYERLYEGRAYLPKELVEPVRREVAELRNRFAIDDPPGIPRPPRTIGSTAEARAGRGAEPRHATVGRAPTGAAEVAGQARAGRTGAAGARPDRPGGTGRAMIWACDASRSLSRSWPCR